MIAIPTPQAATLVSTAVCENLLDSQLRMLDFDPAWVMLVHANWPMFSGFDEVVFQGSHTKYPVARLLRAAPGTSVWQLTANPVWSASNLECAASEVERALLGALSSATGASSSDAQVLATHLWRYAYGPARSDVPDFWKQTQESTSCFPEMRLATVADRKGHPIFFAGDLCANGDAPSAWLTGRLAADSIASFLQTTRSH